MNDVKISYRFNESHSGENFWIPSDSSKKISIFNELEIISYLENVEIDTQISLEENTESFPELSKG